MNTGDLVQTCLTYPEFRLIMTRNSLQQGYNYVRTIFNGFRELEQRKDAGKELISVHKDIDPEEIRKFTVLVEKGQFAFDMRCVEILVSQSAILRSISREDKIELTAKSLSNYRLIEKMPDEYATFGLVTPALVMGRMMDADRFPLFTEAKSDNGALRSFVEHSQPAIVSLFPEMISLAEEYLKQLQDE